MVAELHVGKETVTMTSDLANHKFRYALACETAPSALSFSGESRCSSSSH